jgi:quercetin 2,3-dioxygenase
MSMNPVLKIGRLPPSPSPWPTPDPFLFCVHHADHYPAGNAQLGPAVALDGRDLGQDFAAKDGWNMYHGHNVPGFPQHPHRGFETVTVVRRGLLDHSDSLGATARYGEGDVQWLTAGGGIQHAEMFPLLEQGRDNPVELFQIWLNLPTASKMVPAHFSMFWDQHIPRVPVADAAGNITEVMLVAGRLGDTAALAPPPSSWAADPAHDVAIWTLKMAPFARFVLRAAPGTSRYLYFFGGQELRVAEQPLRARYYAALSDAEIVLENGAVEAELLLLQGRPIGEPVAQRGPFVMNEVDEIRQAYQDFVKTGFGGWPWHTSDPVHAREQGRFAQHADGRVERPA